MSAAGENAGPRAGSSGAGWLWLAGAALLVAGVVPLIHWALVVQVWNDPVGGAGLGSRLETWDLVFTPIALLGTLFAGLALAVFALASGRRRLRPVALIAGGLLAATAVAWMAHWGGIRWHWFGYGGRAARWLTWAGAIGSTAGLTALLAMVVRTAPPLAGLRLALLGLGVAWTAGLPLFDVATTIDTTMWLANGNPWWWLILVRGGEAATLIGLGAALFGAAGPIRREEDDLGWTDVAHGARVLGDGLAWRIAITFCGLFVLFMAVMARSAGLVKLVGLLLPVAGLVTGIVMLAGVASFIRQPPGSPGAAPAWLAFTGMLMSTALDLVALIVIIKMLAAGTFAGMEPSARADALASTLDAGQLAARLPRWGLLFGGISLAGLLLSFGLVGAHLRRHDVVRRVASTVILFVVAVAAVWSFFAWGPRVRDVASALMLMITLIVLALVVALAFLRLVRTVETAVTEHASAPDLPAARLLQR